MNKDTKTGKHLICAVKNGSIAADLQIKAGSYLLSIDGIPVIDVFDYQMRTTMRKFKVSVQSENGEILEVLVEKNEYDDLGLEFESYLMSENRSCKNKCIFCFIDQLPPNLRGSLYFKDDDLRLSFLTGNYVTLTNVDDNELERILSYRLSPINVSVHTTDPVLRVTMMKNKNAGAIMNQLRKIVDEGIDVNCQVVICPGVNDGAALEKTLEDLMTLGDKIRSIALVPVGLTKFRNENSVESLKPMDQCDAIRVAETVKSWQRKFLTLRGERIVFAADEIYIKAGFDFPPLKEYDDLPQIENGVGMVPLFVSDMQKGIARRLKRHYKQNQEVSNGIKYKSDSDNGNLSSDCNNDTKNDNNRSDNSNSDNRSVSIDRNATSNRGNILIITGVDAKRYISAFTEQLSTVYNIKFTVMAIPNHFFGQTVTVAGLVTGNDILKAVNELGCADGYEKMIIPRCMLRSGETVFLDDLSIDELQAKTKMKILCTEPDAKSFLKMLDKI